MTSKKLKAIYTYGFQRILIILIICIAFKFWIKFVSFHSKLIIFYFSVVRMDHIKYQFIINMKQNSQVQIFKQRLYQNFKNIGVLDRLKANLRKNLLDKLQIGTIQQEQKIKQLNAKEKHLPLNFKRKLIINIIAEYLQKNGYEYTYSILLPQAGLEKSQVLTLNQLCKINEIQNYQFKQLKNLKENYSFIDILIYVYMFEINKQKSSRQTQTTFDQPISKKLEKIDKQYSTKIDYWKLGNATNYEQKLEKAKKDTQQMLKNRFQHQKLVLRQELESRIRRQENEKYYKMTLLNKRQLESNYQKKLSELKRREKQAFDSLQKKRKECEQQIAKLRAKELDMIKKYELKQKELQNYYDEKLKKLAEKEKQLQKLELQLRAKKKEYQDCIRMVKNKIVSQAKTQ